MMLTMPPKARPCSAPKPLLTTRNSLTASWEGVPRWEPVALLMVSAPSTVTRLLKSRMPPKEMRVTSDSVKVDCRLVRPVVTPGVSRTKSVNSRPLIGSDSIWLVLITWLTSVRVGSTGGVSVVTVTFSAVEATFTVTSIVATCPTVSTMPVCVDFANPEASGDNSERPGQAGKYIQTVVIRNSCVRAICFRLPQRDAGFCHATSALVADGPVQLRRAAAHLGAGRFRQTSENDHPQDGQ